VSPGGRKKSQSTARWNALETLQMEEAGKSSQEESSCSVRESRNGNSRCGGGVYGRRWEERGEGARGRERRA
jgi:hypothetical protein